MQRTGGVRRAAEETLSYAYNACLTPAVCEEGWQSDARPRASMAQVSALHQEEAVFIGADFRKADLVSAQAFYRTQFQVALSTRR
jgi:hypothetical protein